MKLIWAGHALDDYLHWQATDKKLVKRINCLIKDIQRHPHQGLGAPEPLRHQCSGYWSRRITRGHRLAYKVAEDKIYIAQCRYHYG
ncbi:MAG: Txe/YoeB family addiction module toxin [Mariprofundaceae bacterium]|nr:Txe/YoeB family addiction module toxin [Mariprofundaceae bacterium]